ncbi:hypothetical protein H5P28_01215 [Ruficoccus amylovorans]|uniref:Uncharacterized protein n=1 Tax=Ruficoccus amylovorans TaxID=1804625 RepID=A0A842H9R3_9BACT|nr:hypothetical protein [Ruficoccus amylovorans]MBC2592869.1 hypothetical protein [Ruficoccus amylovorans]
MSVPEKSPIIPLEAFLKKAMGKEVEAGFSDFLSLWESSKGLQTLIRQFVERTPTDTPGNMSADAIPASLPEGPVEEMPSDWRATSAPAVDRRLTQSHGGLSRKELLILLEKHKSGNRDLGLYLLVRAWKKHMIGPRKPLPTWLRQLTLDYWGQAIAENQADYFLQIANTVKFLEEGEFQANGQWNHDPGQWWQFHLLLYVLDHPKNKYPMREFVRYFETEVGANAMPTTKTLRHFCRSVGIALDSTPGAPRKRQQY